MDNFLSRRDLLRSLVALYWLGKTGWAGAETCRGGLEGTFKAIYGDEKLRREFYGFLVNVYHLYPEDKFHRLIETATAKGKSDKEVYLEIQKGLPAIRPYFSDFKYALPSLAEQKKVMSDQAAQLLRDAKKIDGYVEIGTPGRYVSALKDRLPITGQVYLVHDWEPGFGPTDIVERGGLSRVGQYVPLASYDPIAVADGSVDLVSNYIGFHHSPLAKLQAFVESVRRILRLGGKLILRDHDVATPEVRYVVALAHDVFNAGLNASWETNCSELRYFTSSKEQEQMLTRHGFRKTGESLAQAGDPTLNLLTAYTRIS